MHWKHVLKAVRASQPANFLMTTAAKRIEDASGQQWELLPRHLHRIGEVPCRLPNGREMRMWSKGDDLVTSRLFWRGFEAHEPETLGVFFRLAARSRTTFDIGANVGFMTLVAAHASPSSKVYAFEPVIEIFERLRSNVARNDLTNVQAVCCAVGAADGSLEFFAPRPGAEGLNSSASASAEFFNAPERASYRADFLPTIVPAVSLDGFIARHQIGPVDLLKIDTEMTEPDVLRGGREMLARDRPDLICEVLPRGNTGEQIEEILSPLGYHFYHLTRGGPQRREHIRGQSPDLNYLLTTRDPAAVAALARPD